MPLARDRAFFSQGGPTPMNKTPNIEIGGPGVLDTLGSEEARLPEVGGEERTSEDGRRLYGLRSCMTPCGKTYAGPQLLLDYVPP